MESLIRINEKIYVELDGVRPALDDVYNNLDDLFVY